MTQQEPNLFIVGAMKSGTTFLHALLSQHPHIFMCNPKEPSYFVDQKILRHVWPDMWERRLWESEEKYLSLFSKAGDAKILGESSTNYTKLPMIPHVVEKISLFNPSAKFIYIMRNPTERSISHYWHNVRYGFENASLNTAVRDNLEYVNVSYYAMQLRPYIAAFGRENIFLVFFEEFARDPTRMLRDIFRWLEIDVSVEINLPGANRHSTPQIVDMRRLFPIIHALEKKGLGMLLRKNLPEPIRTLLKLALWKRVDQNMVSHESARVYLNSFQEEQTAELEELLGVRISCWHGLSD